MINKKKQGKKNKAAGTRFELKVRKDLESSGWIVSKWMNNIELAKENSLDVVGIPIEDGKFLYGKLIPAKHKFRGTGIPMAIGTGFPDFIAFRGISGSAIPKEVIGVEVKSNDYLDKSEREKCKWLLENYIFSKILIASKGTKRGQIAYKEFK